MKRSLCIVLLLAAGFARASNPGDEIAYWTTQYQGQDLVSGQFACKRPEFPAVSKTRQEIAAVQGRLEAWRACYQRFAANINARTAAGERIPSRVLAMMTPAQTQQAMQHIEAVYAGLAARARKDAEQVAADERAWEATTELYVENNVDPDHGLLAVVRSVPPRMTQTELRIINDAMRGPELAPTGVLH